MNMYVPIIDINSWLHNAGEVLSEEQQNIAVQWKRTFSEFGCAILVGHGIEEQTFEDLNEQCRLFFKRSAPEKQIYNHGIYGHPLGGYTAPGNEIVALSVESVEENATSKPKFDPVENFVFTSLPDTYSSPTGLPSPLPAAQGYFERMNRLLSTIHSISCAALGISDLQYIQKHYDSKLEGSVDMGPNGNALRLAHYPPLSAASLFGNSNKEESPLSGCDGEVRYGAHTDHQGFTLLRPDKSDWHCVEVLMKGDGAEVGGTGSVRRVRVQCGGLEVFHKDAKRWLQVKIPQELNAIVVNAGMKTTTTVVPIVGYDFLICMCFFFFAGDLIQRWTNDTWHSPLHRVVTATASAVTTVPPASCTNTNTDFSTPMHSASSSCQPHAQIAVDTVSQAYQSPTSPSPLAQHGGLLSRQAIVFFTGPMENCVIDPATLPVQGKDDDGGVSDSAAPPPTIAAKYPPIRCGDHLNMKLNRTNQV